MPTRAELGRDLLDQRIAAIDALTEHALTANQVAAILQLAYRQDYPTYTQVRKSRERIKATQLTQSLNVNMSYGSDTIKTVIQRLITFLNGDDLAVEGFEERAVKLEQLFTIQTRELIKADIRNRGLAAYEGSIDALTTLVRKATLQAEVSIRMKFLAVLEEVLPKKEAKR